MSLVPISKSEDDSANASKPEQNDIDWIKIAAGGSLIVGGVLLLTGQRRAGMVAAASGTALALIDQQDALRSWWKILPGYVDQIQRVIGQVQTRVDDIASKRETLQQVLSKAGEEA